MLGRRWILRTALVVCALMCVLPARALASGTEQSILMDDDQFIYSSPSHVMSALEQLKALGVDRVKVSVVWTLLAPNANSRRVPHFDATDPKAYPAGAWGRYDVLTQDAHQLGIGVYFQITPPSPMWAVSRGNPTQGYPWSYRPSAKLFGEFVKAIGRRYSGTYAPWGGAPPLPRVSYWGLWNEPNEGAWLNPQWRGSGRKTVLVAPNLYRQLVDSGYSALKSTGHGHDTILLGETASRGWITPVPFVQALYCVNSKNKGLTGSAATNLGCPRSGSRSKFARQHPGLFASTGYAHHPYSFDTPPNKIITHSLITLANLGVLDRTLSKIFTSAHHRRRGGVPLYLTEWGYKSNPPNPFVKTSLTQQATWLNQGEYMTWKDSYVQALDQFLLYDDGPRAGARPGSRAYWSTFQSGLLYLNGTPKPSYAAFQLPIWLPSSKHRHLTVWGEIRPANHSGLQFAELQYQDGGSGGWSNVRSIQTSSSEGFLLAHLSLPRAGNVRLEWIDSSGTAHYSRTAAVS